MQVSADAEEFRDERWQREGARQVETAFDAERFVDRVGFAACLKDCRHPGPSLYVAICGRRDAVLPRNVQKDPEASRTWLLKDELVRRGRVYYGKLPGARTMFLAPRMTARHGRFCACSDASGRWRRPICATTPAC